MNQRKSAAPRRRAARLLVVDDEANVRALARDALVSLGYVVLETGDPQHALRLAKEQPIHLLVVDVIMPLMKGTEWPTASRP
jgi:CheY-like chemotaxis protein